MRLAKYVCEEHGKCGRVDFLYSRNCISEDWFLAAKEMERTQSRNTKSGIDKTYHLVVSFGPGEQPTREQTQEIVQEWAERFGFSEHQMIVAAHGDTDNYHFHIIANRIHPKTLTMNNVFRDMKKLKEFRADICQKYSLELTEQKTDLTLSENAIQNMEKNNGLESFKTYIVNNLKADLTNAKTWVEFCQILHKNGVKIKTRGNGFVFVDTASGKYAVKASTISRDFSKAKLIQLYGEFTPPSDLTTICKKTYNKEPLDKNAMSLWEQYREEMRLNASVRKQMHSDLNKKLKEKCAEARLEAEEEIKRKLSSLGARILFGMGGKKTAWRRRNMVRSAERQRIDVLRNQAIEERKQINGTHPYVTFNAWLMGQAALNNQKAIAALRRKGLVRSPHIRIAPPRPASHQPTPARDINYSTSRGTIVFNCKNEPIYDYGDSIGVKKSVSYDVLKEAIMIAHVKYDQPLVIYGERNIIEQARLIVSRENLPVVLAEDITRNQRNSLKTNKKNVHVNSTEGRGRTPRI